MNDHTTESQYHHKALGERIERIADCMNYKIAEVALEVLKLANNMKNMTARIAELDDALKRLQQELDDEEISE